MSTNKHSARDLVNVAKDQEFPTGRTDWFYQNLVPKAYGDNLAYRELLLRLCYKSDTYMEEVQCMCRRDMLFEVNSFGYLYSPKDRSDSPIIPWITYDFQDVCLDVVNDSIAGTGSDELRDLDVTLSKSREVGGSWMVMACFEHRWRYYMGQNFLVASSKEEYVCNKGDKNALMQKAEWYTKQLPVFLQPENCEMLVSSKTYHNYDNDSMISGEATVENLGTGGRRTAILLDEAAKMPHAKKIFSSTRDVSRCRIFCSSPFGRQGMGASFFRKVQNPNSRKIWMHWSDIPSKRRGLYYFDDQGNKQQYEPGWKWQNDYDFDQLTFGKRKPRSTWYDIECHREEDDEATIAQELDINFNKSGFSYVSEEVVSRWLSDWAIGPNMWGAVSVDADDCHVTWHPQTAMDDAPFHLWLDLEYDNTLQKWCVPKDEYIIGADIAAGTRGIHASYSALGILSRSTRRQVGRLCLRYCEPSSFARVAVGVCRWFHNALLVPEKQGSHGKAFMDAIETDPAIGGYWNIYRSRKKDLGFEVITEKIGLANTDGGTQIMNNLVDGIKTRNILIPDATVFKEIGQYQMGPDGRIFHTGVRSYDAMGNKGKTHGDVAIAIACAYEELRRSGRNIVAARDGSGTPETIPNECWYRRLQKMESPKAFTL